MNQTLLSNKNILIILPQKKFQDEEFLDLKNHLKDKYANITTATSSINMARGIKGTSVTPDCLISDIDISNFDAVSLVGGVGSIEHWHNKKVIDLLIEADQTRKLICAICLAPVTLANAGLLKNIKATAYNSAATFLCSKGAIYTGNPVEISENIITANGPESTDAFAEAISNSLLGNNSQN